MFCSFIYSIASSAFVNCFIASFLFLIPHRLQQNDFCWLRITVNVSQLLHFTTLMVENLLTFNLALNLGG